MTTETLDEAIAATKKFLPRVQTLLDKAGNSTSDGYLFGPKPTVLDAHVLVFLCRLSDVKRTELIPKPLLEWVEHFRNGAAWKEVMSTVPGGMTLPMNW